MQGQLGYLGGVFPVSPVEATATLSFPKVSHICIAVVISNEPLLYRKKRDDWASKHIGLRSSYYKFYYILASFKTRLGAFRDN